MPEDGGVTTATANPNIERLVADPEPDLSRSAGDGFVVTLTFTPTLEHAERAVVNITAEGGKIVLDVLDVPASDGLAVFRHTTRYSPRFAEALR